ncbi:MAG TPA: hypothetical protein VK929_14295 [Longimicrobiales bacterium]|nr:hypothetical protein [Longimicrobiales bacterium]
MHTPSASAIRDPQTWRTLAWSALILGWLAMLLQLWSAFATFPSAERLEQSRLVAIPTLQSLALLVGRSIVELGVVLALTWPWQARLWITRVCAAAIAVAAWFVATTPLSVSATSWVHRRWLAAMVAGLLLVAAVALLARLTRAAGGRLFRS